MKFSGNNSFNHSKFYTDEELEITFRAIYNRDDYTIDIIIPKNELSLFAKGAIREAIKVYLEKEVDFRDIHPTLYHIRSVDDDRKG